jgi:hypothetical protein
VVSQQTPQPPAAITLEDQFTSAPVSVTVGEPVWFCPPTARGRAGALHVYTAPGPATPRDVLISDQFAFDAPWHVTTPKYIAVPTAKTIDGVTFDDRDGMNHYWCYDANGPRVGARVTLDDQFGGPDNV